MVYIHYVAMIRLKNDVFFDKKAYLSLNHEYVDNYNSQPLHSNCFGKLRKCATHKWAEIGVFLSYIFVENIHYVAVMRLKKVCRGHCECLTKL